jgi:hypothetical protein
MMRGAVGTNDDFTILVFATGATLEIMAPLGEVAKELENAARSSAGTLAWFDDTAAGERLAVNPAHVLWIRAGRR